MSLQLRLFGGNSDAGKLTASNDGGHAIDKSKVLASTDASVITPLNPGNFSSIRSVPVVPAPRYFTKEEADAMKDLAKEKTDGAKQSKRAYEALAKVEEADAKVHRHHRKYEGAVADRVRASQSCLTKALENLHHIVIVHRSPFDFLSQATLESCFLVDRIKGNPSYQSEVLRTI